MTNPKLPRIIIYLMILFPTLLSAQNTMQWRGEGRAGYYPVENMSGKWPIQGPELLLHIDSLPDTYASVVVADGVMYTTGREDTAEVLTALYSDGTMLWETNYGKAWSMSYRNARCTPTIENGKAYVISGSGYLACIDVEDGALAWILDGHSKFNGECGRWGIAESPLIVGNKFIYTPCGQTTTMVALDKITGETIWKSESLGEIASYCSPVLYSNGKEQLIITLTSKYVIGVDPGNGDIRWKFNYSEEDAGMMGSDINPVTPLIRGNEVFITSGYHHAGIMLSIADDLNSVSKKWLSGKMDVHHGGVVYYDGYIFGSNFTSMRNGDWLCLDWNTGEVMYEEEWFSKGQIIATDGYFIIYDEKKGNVGLVKADAEKFNVISSLK